MKFVTAEEASRNLPKLLWDVQEGETVTITSAGKPVARLSAADQTTAEERRREALEKLLEHLKDRPVLNLGKFQRDWAYED